MYLPSTTAAYFVYGEQVKANILNTLPGGATSTIVSVLMTAHLLFGIVIVINPVTQELEHALRVPESENFCIFIVSLTRKIAGFLSIKQIVVY